MIIELLYKEGPTTAAAKPVNLVSGYEARMDIVNIASPSVPLATASSVAGGIALGNGSGANITVTLNRDLTLDAGPFVLGGRFGYDLFLRNTTTNLQVKVLAGSISVKKSFTQWD